MLNVFAHQWGPSRAQFPVTNGKPTEPRALKPSHADRDFLFAVKDNPPDLHDALERPLDVKTKVKKRRDPHPPALDHQGRAGRLHP